VRVLGVPRQYDATTLMFGISAAYAIATASQSVSSVLRVAASLSLWWFRISCRSVFRLLSLISYLAVCSYGYHICRRALPHFRMRLARRRWRRHGCLLRWAHVAAGTGTTFAGAVTCVLGVNGLACRYISSALTDGWLRALSCALYEQTRLRRKPGTAAHFALFRRRVCSLALLGWRLK